MVSAKRQPKGVPVGGQYAENAHDEATAPLGASSRRTQEIAQDRAKLDALKVSDLPGEGERLSFRGERSDVFIERDRAGKRLVYVTGVHGDPHSTETAMSLRDAKARLAEHLDAMTEPDDYSGDDGDRDEDYGFWEGPNDPAVTGTDPSAYRKAISYVGADTVEMSHPTRAQAKGALTDPEGKKSAGAVRGVSLDRTNDGEYDVSAPREGAPIVVLSQSGESTLNIVQGRAVVKTGDEFGSTTVTAAPGTEVVVIATRSNVTVRAEEGSRVTVVAEPGATGVVSGAGSLTVVSPEHVPHNIRVNRETETPF